MFNNTSTRCLGLHDGALLGDVDAVKKFSDILVLDLHTLLDEGSCRTQKHQLAYENSMSNMMSTYQTGKLLPGHCLEG